MVARRRRGGTCALGGAAADQHPSISNRMSLAIITHLWSARPTEANLPSRAKEEPTAIVSRSVAMGVLDASRDCRVGTGIGHASEHLSPFIAGPTVRIHLPPAASLPNSRSPLAGKHNVQAWRAGERCRRVQWTRRSWPCQ
jgi:hypothetical protein